MHTAGWRLLQSRRNLLR